MRMLKMAVAILGIGATMSFAQAQSVNKNGNREPFDVNFGKLSAYLNLTATQIEDVFHINEYFVQQQKESLRKRSLLQEAGLQKAVYGNLKLMKKTLNADQYRKYVILLNVTNNNNRLTGETAITDSYFAANK